MTPFLSARLPGTSVAAFLTACMVAASAASLALAALPAAAAESDTAGAASSAAELDWARDALARNEALEVVSTDPANRTITVRVKITGQVRHVRADQVVAMLPTDASARRTPAAPVGGRVIASGPGYSIAAVSPAAGAGAPGTTAEPESATGAGAARNSPVEHRHEPLVCQGAQLRHINNRNLVFDGDAVSVEKGCELLITNSSITAHGVGITARGASVHVDNSIIEGSGGAVDASDGAQVYARFSVFKGLIRRNDTSDFHDLGGNVGN